MFHLRRTALAFLFLLCVVWVAAPNLNGQAITATLGGRILDPSGDAIPQANVTITNVATNEQHSVTTQADGIYVFPLLPRGMYTVTVEAAGFQRNVHKGISLEVGQSANLNITMVLGSQNQTVQVSGDAPVVQTENAALGGVVSQESIQQLPLNSLTYSSLALLQPNVFLPAQNSSLGFRGGINIAGQSEVSNDFTLDGIDNMDEASNQTNVTPVLDAVEEFRVLSGNYAAEYGRASGGHIIVATKSGSNAFHGSGYEFYRNSVLDAENIFAPTKPTFTRNQYGGTIGGPIKKDKVFFFASYGGLRSGAAVADIATVPTALMHQGNFSQLAPNGCGGTGLPACLKNPFTGGVFAGDIIPQQYWSSQGSGLLSYYPTTGIGSGLTSNLAQSTTQDNAEDQTSGRVDWVKSDKTSVFVSYNYAHIPNQYPLQNSLCGSNLVAGFGCDELYHSQLLSVSMTHIFNPHLVWEARAGFNRLNFARTQDDYTLNVDSALGITGLLDAGAPNRPFNNGVPSVGVTGMSTIGGATNLPQGRSDNDFNYITDLTIVKGAHTIKIGLDVRRFQFNSFFTSDGRGAFKFNGQYTGNAIADLLVGLPSQATRDPGVPYQYTRDLAADEYVQDDWKVKSDLTLNLGLRYEINLPPDEVHNEIESYNPTTNSLIVAGGIQALPIINTAAANAYPNGAAWQGSFLEEQPYPSGSRLWNTQYKNLAPRFGFAWSPFGSSKWVIRGGTGIFFDQQELGNGISTSSRGLPFRLSQTAINTTTYNAATTYNLANSFSGPVAGSLSAFGVTQNFKTATEGEWSMAVERELTPNTALTVTYMGSHGYNLPVSLNLGQSIIHNDIRPEAGWGAITQIYSDEHSDFNSLNVRFERRFSNGISFLLSYGYSHSIDEGYGISTSSNSSLATPQNSYDIRDNRGSSDYDIRNRLVYNALYALPFGHGKYFMGSASGVKQAVLGDWSLSGIVSVQGGTPFTLLMSSSFDQSETFGFKDLPNVVGNPNVAGAVAANPTCVAPTTIHTTTDWFNPCAFLVPAKGNFGDEGRNTLLGPGLQNVDFSLIKNIRIKERANVEFKAEAFNLFNHPNFGVPLNSIGSFSTAGVITDKTVGTINTASGPDLSTGAQREIQFGVHVTF